MMSGVHSGVKEKLTVRVCVCVCGGLYQGKGESFGASSISRVLPQQLCQSVDWKLNTPEKAHVPE